MKLTILAWCLTLTLVLSCGKSQNGNAETDNVFSDSALTAMLRPSPEKVALLSAKYSVPESVVASIIWTYEDRHDIVKKAIRATVLNEDRELTTFRRDTAVGSTLREFSESFRIPKETVASILIDYQLWTSTKE